MKKFLKIILISVAVIAGLYAIGNQPQTFGITIPKLDLLYLDGSEMKPRGAWDLDMGAGSYYGDGSHLTGISSADEKVKYDAGDTTSGYVVDKFVAGVGISLSEGTGANANKLKITNAGMLLPPIDDWYDPTAGLPVSPAVGDRYISDGTGSGWTDGYVYEWDGVSWIETEPEEGYMIWDLLDLIFYVFFSGGWMEVGDNSYWMLDTNQTLITGDKSGSFDISTTGDITATNLAISNWNTAYGWGDHAGLYDTIGTASGLIGTHESTYDHTLIATALQAETDPTFTTWLGATPPLYPGGWYDAVQNTINLSGFTNDLGNYGGFLTAEADTLSSVTGRGTSATATLLLQNALAVEFGKDAATNTGGKVKFWSIGANDYYTTIASATNTANLDITLPTAPPAGTYLLNMTTGGAMGYDTNTYYKSGDTPTFAALNLSATSNQIVMQSAGVTTTLTESGATTNKVITFPNFTGTLYISGGTDVAIADGGTGASLSDPGADRIMFWDESANAVTWLAMGNSVAITTTTLDTIQDIRTSASPTFTGLTLSGLTTKRVLYSVNDVITDSANFVYDGTNLGVGTGSPSASFHASRGDGSYQYKMERTGTNARVYGFGADSNGLFFLDDVTAGARRITISTAGNLGLNGATSPLSLLSIGGGSLGAGTANALRIYDDGGAQTSTTSNSVGFGFNGSTGQISYTTGTSGLHVFYQANTERLRIDATGIGIGEAPHGMLSFINSATTELRTYTGSDNQGIINYGQVTNYPTAGGYQRVLDIVSEPGNAGSAIRFLTGLESANPSAKMIIDASGKVGINTADPITKLNIVGDGDYWSGLRLEYSGASGNGWHIVTGTDNTLYFGYGGAGGATPVTKMYLTSSGVISLTSSFYTGGNIVSTTTYATTVGATNRDVYIDNTGLLGYVSSSKRYKENITDIGDTSWIYKLRPVNFDYKDRTKGVGLAGFLAEEVALVNPKIVSFKRTETKNEDGTITYGEDLEKPETVNYSSPYMITSMLSEIQNLNNRIKVLEAKIK